MHYLRVLAHLSFLCVVVLLGAGCVSQTAENPPEAPIETTPPSAEDLPLGEPDLPTQVLDNSVVLGDWTCQEGPEQAVSFREEDGENVFQSYLQGRPMSTGTWQWFGNALAIEGTGGDFRFDYVTRSADQLTLAGDEERWVCTLVSG